MPNPEFHIPGAPAELMAIINTRRATIPVGLTMMADEPAPEAPAADTPSPDPAPAPDDGFKSEESKRAVLADLHKEREERKALQQQITEMQQSLSVVEQLRKALTTPDAPAPENPADLAAQIAEMKAQLEQATQAQTRTSLAEGIADEIGITAMGDIKLIAAQQDEGAMRALAARLKGATPGPITPKPDPSAGRSGDPKPANLAEAISQHYSTQK